MCCTATEGASGYLTIDTGALRRNYAALTAKVAPCRVAAVVKADAYGLGATLVSRAVYDEGCRDFFVAQFGEAVALRPDLPADARIFVLNGLQPGNEAPCAQRDIIPVINSPEQLQRWSATARAAGRVLPAVLQFDSGMSRIGFAPGDRAALAASVAAGLDLDIRFIMSHLASADDPDSAQNAAQLAETMRIVAEFPGFDLSLSNSGGVFLGSSFHGILARPGVALYGGVATMAPVVSLDVAVVQTRTVPAGTMVGYGGTHVTTGQTRLATIAAGYADGLPRSLGGRGAVYLGAVRLPIAGRVSMDSITVDISALPEGSLTLGSLVEVIGPHQTLDDLARDAGTISYEILTSLGRRYHRIYR